MTVATLLTLCYELVAVRFRSSQAMRAVDKGKRKHSATQTSMRAVDKGKRKHSATQVSPYGFDYEWDIPHCGAST